MKKYIGLSFIALSLGLASCNDYLDKLPDDRATVDTEEKAAYLLVDAYPAQSVDFMMEQASDNIYDNGAQYSNRPNQDYMYRWEPITTTGNDDPYYVWNAHYSSAATANQVLASLESLPQNDNTAGIRAEALLCRAWAIFRLSNAFCMAYDPNNADKYLGLPYPKVAGVSVDERGTLKELYDNINADIEEALPLLSDDHLKSAKYHFNTKAAYAFAARFNLYYHNYDKAIQYATAALGNDPAGVLRNIAQYNNLAGVDDINNAYVRSAEKANLLIINSFSLAGRAQYSSSYRRYATPSDFISNELFWVAMPWGSGSGANTLWYSHLLYGSNQGVYYPKMMEFFEVKDKIAQTGSPRIVDVVLTTDETLLVRAEAYALKKDYANAVADINLWTASHCEASRTYSGRTARRPEWTEELVNKTIDDLSYAAVVPASNKERSIKKKLKPQGFTVEEGTQENFIQLILHLRRLETWQQGLRFQDIKRYGIEFSHNIDGANAIIFKPGDPRGAIQLPADAISAGLEPNSYTNNVTETALSEEDKTTREFHITE